MARRYVLVRTVLARGIALSGANAQEEIARVVLEYDASWIGKEFDRYTYNVTKEEIVTFATALGETNPLYTDEAYAKTTPYGGLIAPPTFCVAFRSNARLPDLKLNYGKRGFDGDSIVAGCRQQVFETAWIPAIVRRGRPAWHGGKSGRTRRRGNESSSRPVVRVRHRCPPLA